MSVKVSIIPYLNTIPFLYGLQNQPISSDIEFDFAVPSLAAKNLKEGKIDIGIIPVAAIPEFDSSHIVTDYCIGANGPVASVLICSPKPLEEIKVLYLDLDSRTSALLTKVLAQKYWNIEPYYLEFNQKVDTIDYSKSYLLIGDKAMKERENFHYIYDLSEEWKKFRDKPFVFACWVTNKNLEPAFLDRFNSALKYGVENIEKALNTYPTDFSYIESYNYLKNNISYPFNADKREGLSDFWSLALEELKSKVRW